MSSRISFAVRLLTSKDVMKERFRKADRHLVSDTLGISEQKITLRHEPNTEEGNAWDFSFKIMGLSIKVEGVIRYKGEKGARMIISNGEASIRTHLRRMNPQVQAEVMLEPLFEKLFKEEKKPAVIPEVEHGFGGGLLGLGAAQKAPVHMPEPVNSRTEMNGIEVTAEEEENRTVVG